MASSHGDGGRTKLSSKASPFGATKLSSKASPFRPCGTDSLASTSISLTSSLTLPLQGYSSDLDSSTGSVGDPTSWSIPGPRQWTSPGQFQVAPSSWTDPSHSWQALAASSTTSSSCGEFRLGDFSSKILNRAKNSKEPAFRKKDPGVNFENILSGEIGFAQALMFDPSFVATRSATGKGQHSSTVRWPSTHHGKDAMPESSNARAPQSASSHHWPGHGGSERHQAMNQCMESIHRPDAAEDKGPASDIRAPLRHASTFDEATQRPAAAAASGDPKLLPVRNTFIHFSENSGPEEPAFQCAASAPAIMLKQEWHTKYPAMEVAHIRGECRPCVYFTKKQDGCRWGEECEFCHLCPVGSLLRKRKEKVKAIREQEFLERCEKRRPFRRADARN